MLYDFSVAKNLLKSGVIMRRQVWGSGCFIYYNKKHNKYYTQFGNIIELKDKIYKNTNDWEKLNTHLSYLKEKFYELENKYNSLKNIINYLTMNIDYMDVISKK